MARRRSGMVPSLLKASAPKSWRGTDHFPPDAIQTQYFRESATQTILWLGGNGKLLRHRRE